MNFNYGFPSEFESYKNSSHASIDIWLSRYIIREKIIL